MADRRVQASRDGHLGSGSGGFRSQPFGQGRVGRQCGQLFHHPGGVGGRVAPKDPPTACRNRWPERIGVSSQPAAARRM